VGPRAGLDAGARRKICPCRGSNLDRPIVQPVVDTILPELPQLQTIIKPKQSVKQNNGFVVSAGLYNSRCNAYTGVGGYLGVGIGCGPRAAVPHDKNPVVQCFQYGVPRNLGVPRSGNKGSAKNKIPLQYKNYNLNIIIINFT
jgi:hypothetical protein